ncbi:MAG TPA: c-type cytochrome [Gemmatimonadaceae bacterium]|nr:c-type cytochrome [Gemmatimonadaceae bacterium]
MTARARVAVAAVTLVWWGVACGRGSDGAASGAAATAAVARPADVRPTPAMPRRFATIGRPATPEEIRAWDIDVNPDGKGLPPGRGTYAVGAEIFARKCASCHGPRGEGMGPYPRLVGREPRDGFPFGQDLKYVKTIGNYWPYATTVYDYVHRAMPLTAPGSLQPDEVYSLTAFLLAENEIIGRDAVMDANTLPRVRMPARSHFVVDDRKGGPGFR